jgi:hypothetical protein
MLIALSFASDLLRAGQMSTHNAQPVQSSGATWMVYFSPNAFQSRSFASADLNVAGAASSTFGSYTFARITPCGHTIAHFPH